MRVAADDDDADGDSDGGKEDESEEDLPLPVVQVGVEVLVDVGVEIFCIRTRASSIRAVIADERDDKEEDVASMERKLVGGACRNEPMYGLFFVAPNLLLINNTDDTVDDDAVFRLLNGDGWHGS
eukprot:CAMPEP_0170838248 /NCGR_PEP_ID=MMETSP0734-20130129/3284_1 /TAXON_ID=186038 /ORGANISM="Fragilariopsis kerguelensis, Strain L26-C5" /LENGTH=124 /DNA_ID=CAMNT_0011205659 /DNA_START=59 /DNA_END=433 /DNA_ORIENTATION=-